MRFVLCIKGRAACLATLLGCIGAPATGAVYVAENQESVPHFTSHPVDGTFKLLLPDDSSEPRTAAVRAPKVSPALLKRRAQLDPLIERVAARQSVEPALVRAVIEVESQFHVQALSPKGALGAMQLMPETARRYGVTNRGDPAQNIEGGVAYLKDLLGRFSGNMALALAAYNAGERAVDTHGRVIPRYRETMLYVPKVLEAYQRYREAEARSPR